MKLAMIQAFDFKGHARSLPYAVKKQGNVTYVSLSKSLDYSGIRSIDFEFEDHIAQAGDEGYIVLPNRPQNASMLCRFTEKADTEYTSDSYVMPIFGFKTAKKSLLAIVSGMAYAYTLVCGVKGGKYYVFPRFEINGEPPYEDICVEYHALEKNQ
ncbi:MAG: hypothetical protein IJT66_00790, partial [Clostridia bacterium]|nr:hypothetical protein [Clostridia bacterium]